MWNEDQSEWQKLKRILNEGAKGSLAVVTTRLSTVACITGTIPNYCLQPLLEDQSWSLIKNHAFGNRAEENPKLLSIRKAILERFQGIPQVAKSIGRLLGLKTVEKEWRLTSRSDIWQVPENKIISVLRLSSKHLSPHVRLCFAYCSMFPKGYLLEKDELICLWMANGFILSHGDMIPEDIGDAIFNEWLERSFFKKPTEDIYGNIVACKMHDLMHDLASTLMVGEISTIEVGKNTEVQDHGHLSLICEPRSSSITLDPIFKSHPTLRALLFFQSLNIEYPFLFDFSSLRCLRALNLRGMSIDELPPSICDLKHLRYLNLSKNDITSLPESIHNLRDLQTLNLSRNRKLTSLPLSIGDLQDLRHFNLSTCSLESLPESIQHLRNLQMLDLSGNVEITTLPLFEGSLRHFNLSQCSLTSLPESILSLTNLQMLDLSRNYRIMSLPMSIGMLQSLRCLNLSDCKLITSLPESLCLLTKLQAVILRRCSSLGMLPEKLGSMSSLRHLDLQGCRELTKMPVEIGKLTYLQTLNLFTVGRSDRHSGYSGIKELEGLNQLKGELEILGLEHVNDSENARAANLKSKYFLTQLKLSWGDFLSSEENSNHNELEGLMLPSKDTVLESFLLPTNNNVLEVPLPPNTKQLIIHGYPWESCFPREFEENLSGMRLRSLQISDCKRLATLPDGLEMLTSLKELRIECCNGIDSLPVMATQGLHTSLLSMTIETCKSLSSVSEGLLYLTSLLNLSFQHCPELEFATADFQHLISLPCLRIGWLPKLRAFPEGVKFLSVLHHLEIEYCWHLRTLPNGLQYLTSLQRLKIHYCPQLQLAKEDFQNLIFLQTLEIEFLPKLISFPEEIHLTLLQHLKILRCENLKMLSEGVKYLTALQSLTIRNCHGDLHKKYEKEKGEDWHLISHIPHIDIENPSKDSVTSADKPQWHKESA